MLRIAENGVLDSGIPAAERQTGGNRDAMQGRAQTFVSSQANQAAPEAATPPMANFSKSDMCFNHPWRRAYARCSYCKRPFCYADLVEYHKQQYCLEDLGYAAESRTKNTSTPNRFTYLASILFLASSLMIFYYTYPQLALITSLIGQVGVRQFLRQLTYSSDVIILSLIFAVAGFVSSVTVLSNSGRRFLVSSGILFVMILFFSYEYLSTTSTGTPDYFFYVTIILFLNLLMLVLSRIGFVGRSSEKVLIEQIEWPKIEVF